MRNYSTVLVTCITWEEGGQATSCVAHHPSRNSHCQPQAFSSAETRLYQCRKITDNLEKQNCDPWHLASAAVWNSSSHWYVAVLVLPSWWVVWTVLFLEHFFCCFLLSSLAHDSSHWKVCPSVSFLPCESLNASHDNARTGGPGDLFTSCMSCLCLNLIWMCLWCEWYTYPDPETSRSHCSFP